MKRCAIRPILFAFAMTRTVVGADALAHEPPQLRMERREARIGIANFVATDQAGRRFEFASLRGKVVVVAFAYTSCPDVCPLITAAARQVQSRLTSAEQRRAHLLTVTTDPEIDSPKIIAAYAERFSADLENWTFLTGSEAELGAVWKKFGVGVRRRARGLVDHTPLTAIVDKHGVMRVAYVGASPDPRQVLADVRRLLNER